MSAAYRPDGDDSWRRSQLLAPPLLRRLKHLEAVLVPCERLAAGRFTVADILMTDVFGYQRQCLP